MKQMLEIGAKISTIDFYVPTKKLTNFDLEKMVETRDDWIVKRTGIRERRLTHEQEFSSDLSIKAIQQMLDQNPQIDLRDVDMIIVATSTSDYPFPSVASQIQAHFQIPKCGTFDLGAACAGFTYGLNIAHAFISSNQAEKVLVVGVDTLTKITDYSDRTTCILFGDGAGVALVEKIVGASHFLQSDFGTYGDAGIHLYVTGLSQKMMNQALIDNGKIIQNGREIYRMVVSKLTKDISSFVKRSGYQFEEIDWFVPHSANLRMIEAMCERLQLDSSKVLFSGTFYGNTSTASIPIALAEAIRAGKIRPGDTLLLSGFGGGFTYSNLLLKW